ncbi:hypothetical protein [Corynebacterium lubricantis]|uniref:hypothetical protein n=1 Tax=Corynebacterium lubricantis TaxID=541095 RepID=UPI0003611008|nr:hypothetical protein [Corynebacterium lubricantis]
MAFTTVATSNTTIGPSQFADITQALGPRFLVDKPGDLRPSYSNGSVIVQSGSATVAGTRVNAIGSNSVAVASGGLSTRRYAVVLRVDWSKGVNDSAQLVAIQEPTFNTTSAPDTTKINLIPGVLYDAVIAYVVFAGGYTSPSQFIDYRPWGGDGGPIRVTQQALNYPQFLDMRAGSMITVDRGSYTRRLDDDMVWRDVGTASNPWKQWQPILRYYGDKGYGGNNPNDGTAVFLGTGGSYRGYYRVVDGMLDGFISITTATGRNFGRGQITVDLPLACADWMPDTWSTGHIYINADRPLDFPMEILIKSGWMRGTLFAPASGDYSNTYPHRISQDGTTGTGVPKLASGWHSTGDVYTMHLSYPVAD